MGTAGYRSRALRRGGRMIVAILVLAGPILVLVLVALVIRENRR